MLQTYQGYFREGRFISPELAAIPNDVKVYVTIIDSVMPPVKINQNEKLKRFFMAIDAIDDEPITDEDLADFSRNRVNFKRKE